MTRSLSPAGVRFLASFEGFVDHPYNDPVGFATIGYGHLLHRSNVTDADRAEWGKISHAKGLDLLEDDAAMAEHAVLRNVHVALTAGQFDALVSFVYNCGEGGIRGGVRTAVNSKPSRWNPVAMRRWHGRVAVALGAWTHAGGHTLPGLVRRRGAEARLFGTGKYV